MGKGKHRRRRRRQRRRASWADLPEDMLGDVLRRLPSFADRARFRGVCRAWCAAWRRQPHPPMPWLAVPGHCISLPDGAIHRVSFPPEAARCLGSFGDWLALVTEKEPSSGSVAPFLMNPFSRARMPLPPRTETERICKIVMSSAPGSESCVVAAMIDCSVRGGENRRRIAACRPGDQGAWWPVSMAFDLQDIIFYEGKLHVLPSCDQLVVFDSRELDLLRREPWRLNEQQPPPPAAKIDYGEGMDDIEARRYLMECKGRLLTVIRYLRGNSLTAKFEVHALAQIRDGTTAAAAKDRWVPVKSFSGRALYVGDFCSGSYPAASDTKAEDRVKENEICFLDEVLEINVELNKRCRQDVVYGGCRRSLREVESYSILSRSERIYRHGKLSARTGRWEMSSSSRFPNLLKVRRFPPATVGEDLDLIPVVI